MTGAINAPVPLRIRGVDYPSIRAAAQALGVSYSTVANALDRGTLEYIGMGTKSPAKGNPIAVTIRGIAYRSNVEAAAALGVSRQAVARARANDTLDSVGLTKHRGKAANETPVLRQGRDSRREAPLSSPSSGGAK